MSKTKSIEIKCLNPNCKSWFPSPIFFEGLETFDSSSLSGNTVNCPYCQEIVPCNKENMRFRAIDGGFKGNDTF